MPHQPSVTLSIADAQDRQSIYALRHQVYARELRQHLENRDGLLTDVLDQVNTYLVAKRGNAVVGFVAITPPNPHGYSVDKYFARRDLPFTFDNRLFEVRLLTVVESDRRTMLAPASVPWPPGAGGFGEIRAHVGGRAVPQQPFGAVRETDSTFRALGRVVSGRRAISS